MQYEIMPKYVKCIRAGFGKRDVNSGEVFDTSVPNDFSQYNWGQILLKGGVDNWVGYFKEITEMEYYLAKGIPVLDYSIY